MYAEPSDTSKLIGAAPLRELLGDISDMTLWRWLGRSDLNFPQPIVISRRRYWRKSDIDGWLEKMAAKQVKSDSQAEARA